MQQTAFQFKLIVAVTGKKSAGLMYVLVIATSCFIASFSIFAITTSDNLYLLFHILIIYSFINSYRSYKDSKIFTGYLVLALLIASCIASKLFGVLLLAALLLFHYVAGDRRNLIGIRSVHPNTLIWLGGAFFSGVVLINVLPMHPNSKLILAVPGRAIVNCQVVDVPFYNSWFRILLQRNYAREGGKQYTFTAGIWDSKTKFDYLLTSPIYYPEFEESLGQFDAVKVKTLAIKGIDILSVWRNTKGATGRR